MSFDLPRGRENNVINRSVARTIRILNPRIHFNEFFINYGF